MLVGRPIVTSTRLPGRGRGVGEHVVGELGHGPGSRRLAHRPPAAPGRRAAPRTPRPPPRGSSGRRTTSPVTPSSTASAAPPESPATCGTPHAAASTNTMPNPSCSRPPQRRAARHGEHVGAAVQRRQVGVGHPAEERAPARRSSPASRRRRRSSRPPPAMASRRSGDAAPAGRGAIATSKPLRGTSREIDTISSASAGQAEALAGRRRRSGVVERAEALDVDAGRHDRDGQRPARRRAPPRRRRTRPADTMWRARRSTLASAWRLPGKPRRAR